ncbi:MAG TPA: ATP-binding protein [Alphaproteobacteria bacterium]|jgi:PAS domain S-box-containing protein
MQNEETPSLSSPRAAGDRLFEDLANFAPVMIWRSGTDALCDWFNKPWLEFVGRAMEQEIGNGWAENVHPDDFDRCLDIYTSSFRERRPFTMVYRLKRRDGAYRDILDNGAAYYRDGEFAGYFGSCIDISDQVEMEKQLRQSQKMEAIGQLTGGVAHDFNNLLQVIGGSLDLLKKDLPSAERPQRRLHNAIDAVKRGATLAGQLLAFARRQELVPKATNLGRVIRGMDDLFRRSLGEAVKIEIAVEENLWSTHVDPVQVESALLNLAVNARDAMDGRGTLAIQARNMRLDESYTATHAEVAPGEYVMVSVNDTGSGMPPDVAERVFEPFFTTKKLGEGTGLGLSMVHGFVKQSYGHIRIDSEVGRGTTVSFFLPRATALEEESQETAPAASATRGSATVLLVEDDEHVRAITADILLDLGYQVLVAHDADAAMAIIDRGHAIDLLFTDVVMPGSFDATELARRARERLPGLPVLFTSGYTNGALAKGAQLQLPVELLPKPYSREELARKLDDVMSSAARLNVEGNA